MEEIDAGFWLEVLKDEGFGFAGAVLLPAIVGIALGLVIAVLAYAVFRLTKLINPATPRPAKILTIVWLVLVLPVLLGILGFHAGVMKGARKLVTEGRVADVVVPQVGGEVASFVLELDGLLAHQLDGAPLPGDRAEAVETLDAAAFVERANRGADMLVEKLLPELAEKMKAENSVLSEGVGEGLFDWFVGQFGEGLLRGYAKQKNDPAGLVGDWFTGLPAAAQEHGDGGLIGKQELASYTAESLIRSALLRPFQTIEKIQRALGVGLVLLVLAVPAIILLVLRLRETRQPSDSQSAP